ncbi:MAG TPA: peptidogalycan biosysnthesis protein, partial [Polyangiaceae bacterium]|nr:peptidogalycan biosysnthesis protein [Polyangiaceae bacterium]
VEECIRRGLSRFEPGAGGEHKVARGFEPTVTHSAHHLQDRRLDAAIRDYLRRERDAIAAEVEAARDEGRLRPKEP